MGHRVHFGTLRLGWAPPCWPPKQSMLVLRHYQPAPPTHALAPPLTRDAEAPGRWGRGSVDPAGAGDSRCLGETLDSEGGSEKRPGLLPAPETAPGHQDPQTPEPRGVPLRMHLAPKLTAATRLLRWKNRGPERGRAGALMPSSRGLPGP